MPRVVCREEPVEEPGLRRSAGCPPRLLTITAILMYLAFPIYLFALVGLMLIVGYDLFLVETMGIGGLVSGLLEPALMFLADNSPILLPLSIFATIAGAALIHILETVYGRIC